MIQTKRLNLVPLTHAQLLQYIKVDGSLEAELQLNATTREISPALKEALETTFIPNTGDPDKNYLYNTLWTLIQRTENRMVGDLCFVGEPNDKGEIEIGYGTYESFQGKGFMTEAVGGMIQWAQTQPRVKAIVATTNKDNTASWAVLEKNGFLKCGEAESLFHWRYEWP